MSGHLVVNCSMKIKFHLDFSIMASSSKVLGSPTSSGDLLIIGDTTKSLRTAWNNRVSDLTRDILVDENRIRQLFNDLKLFPSKSQVYEMVHCARKGACGGIESGSDNDFLTFGEFCIFATELRRFYDDFVDFDFEEQNSKSLGADMNEKKQSDSSSGCTSEGQVKLVNNGTAVKKNGCSYDVFLGGSCNPTTWRKDLAIPHFKSAGITFYNPQQSNWVPEMIELEHQAKQTSRLLFFVANEKTRNVVSMIEISYLAGKKRTLICCLSCYPEKGHSINGESLSPTERWDLQGGMTVVNDLVERNGIPVFDNIQVALECATKVVKEDIKLEDLSLQDGARPVLHADLQIGDKLVRLREAFDQVDTARTGKISLSDLRVAFKIHVHRDLGNSDLKKISYSLKDAEIDFNSFCCIVAEFNAQQNNPKLERNKPKPRGLKAFFSRIFQRNSSRNHHHHHKQSPASTSALSSRRGSSVRDVYLGGSANGNWRKELAIPFLKKHGLTSYNPQAVMTKRRLMPMWAAAIDKSRVLLFVISGNSRSVGAMNEAAFYIGQGLNNVVLVVQSISAQAQVIGDTTTEELELDTSTIAQECLSKLALKDYNRGRSYLSDIANREGIPVFDNVEEALQCVVDKCKNNN